MSWKHFDTWLLDPLKSACDLNAPVRIFGDIPKGHSIAALEWTDGFRENMH